MRACTIYIVSQRPKKAEFPAVSLSAAARAVRSTRCRTSVQSVISRPTRLSHSTVSAPAEIIDDVTGGKFPEFCRARNQEATPRRRHLTEYAPNILLRRAETAKNRCKGRRGRAAHPPSLAQTSEIIKFRRVVAEVTCAAFIRLRGEFRLTSPHYRDAVSYTHLTLPTILRV